MPVSLAERIVNRVAERTERARTSRRGFLGGAALVGAALAVNPWSYLTRPASAYDSVCGADNTCGAGYSVFCCTINGGKNSCPPVSFIGGWWKADNSSFCGGHARYYIDCNAYRDGRYACRCNRTTCDQRLVACNQFRYGQCNTQIPWSSTGPVLCRVVSCTPPWVQFGGTCSSSSATDNNTASHTAPCIVNHAPVGYVDQIASTGNTVRIKGWTYDPDATATSLSVHIYQDGKFLRAFAANKPRPDVNTARHVTGQHGFDISFTATNGYHYYSVWAINIGPAGSNPRLGGRGITVNPGVAPTGYLDSAVAVGRSVVLTGWAFDRDVPSTSIGIAVYQDGKRLPDTRTTVNRPDVNAAYKITGIHGFKITIPTTVGTHAYRVWALNAGGGTANRSIASRTVVVPASVSAASEVPAVAGTPARLPGRLDSVTAAGNSVRLVGWVPDTDPEGSEPGDGAGTVAAVMVHEDDHTLHWYPARSDPAAFDRGTGRRAFDFTIPAGTGVHTYTAYGLGGSDALGGSDDDSLLGDSEACESAPIGQHTVRVNQSGPLGRVDSVRRMGDTVRITGWAHDPDRPASRPALTVFRDGVALSRHETGSNHPELTGAAQSARAGFDITLADLPGTHTYTVYAAHPDSTAAPIMLGGRTMSEDEDASWTAVPV
jgi:hypothetical protein